MKKNLKTFVSFISGLFKINISCLNDLLILGWSVNGQKGFMRPNKKVVIRKRDLSIAPTRKVSPAASIQARNFKFGQKVAITL